MSGRVFLEGGAVVTMDGPVDAPHGAIHWPGTVVLERGTIADVGPAAEVASRTPASPDDTRVDASGHAVLPGLVDLHCHTGVERAGHTESLDLWSALTQHWYPMMRALDEETVYRAALKTYADSVRAGVTAFNDMFRHVESAARAALELGVRGHYASLVARDEDGLDRLADNAAAYRAIDGAGDGRIAVRVGLEWLPLATPELLDGVRALADELDTGIHLHLSESQGEVAASERAFGLRPVRAAHAHGLLGPRSIAAHCVWVDDEELDLLRASGTKVAHAPTANAKLGSGLARVPDFLHAGLTVGLGHDSTEGNNTYDLFEVMRVAVLLQRATRLDPLALSPAQALAMATSSGAKALGLDAGVLAPGRRADAIVVDTHESFFDPAIPAYRANLATRLVFATSGHDVRDVFVDGQAVVRDGELLTGDVEEITARSREAIAALKDAIPIPAA
jgi:5-methylthioadenosine/S-adenosylhomocysteine deaminase